GWITMGERVRSFEQAFAGHHGAADAVAVGSCTAGLHLALRALGVGPGDEVLVPSLTFVATVNSVLYVGATPVFVDIEDLRRPHLSLADAAAKCTPRTRAVIVMHYAGYLMDGDAWRAFARSRGLLLIEDAAHAVGAAGVGAAGDAAVFSFFGNKNMTTAEGGMVLAADPEVLARVRRMRSHGMTTSSWERSKGYALGYDVPELGYNYRMDELRAALGLVQLGRLAGWNAERQRLTGLYRQKLGAACAGVVMPFAEGDVSAHHVLPVLLPAGCDRAAVMQAMRTAGVQTTVHYPCVHQFSYYRSLLPAARLPLSEAFAARELTLPLHPALGDGNVDVVVAALADALATAGAPAAIGVDHAA
ncbi:MAG TPA: DegT/DnrJ/EryC1/StrS family aminotransferase, partial [Rhodospirillales bacterium]|nr:DegT/DnrJ/EryC1/StrS family aminotransferase [Rhodospirillales bacterium]